MTRMFEGVLHNLNICGTDFQKNVLPEYQKLHQGPLNVWLFVSLLTLVTFQYYKNVYSLESFPVYQPLAFNE